MYYIQYHCLQYVIYVSLYHTGLFVYVLCDCIIQLSQALIVVTHLLVNIRDEFSELSQFIVYVYAFGVLPFAQ